MSTIEEQKSRGGGNPLSSLIEKSKQISAMGMVGIIALILTTSVVVAPVTSWLLSISRSVGESNSKLEAVTVSQSEWERLQHMSLSELRTNKTTLATPYKVGDGFQVKVNLGDEGYFSGGKCGNIPSGKNANCFKDTTITVFNNDGDRLFSSRQLPLQVGIYTAEEIDAKLTALNNALKNDYTTKINNEATARANAVNSVTSRLNGKEFVKNRTTSYDLNLRYEKKANEDSASIHAYVGDTEVPLASLGGGGAWGTPIAIAGKAPTENNVGWYGPASGTLSANEWTAYTFVAQSSGLLLATSINGECIKVNGVNSIGHVISRDYGSGPITTTVPVNKGDIISIWGGNWAYLVPFK